MTAAGWLLPRQTLSEVMVSYSKVLLLGAIAGGTIFLGLPLGRMRRLTAEMRALLNAVAVGILLFLVWDILSAAISPVEDSLKAASVEHTDSWWRFVGFASVFTGALGIGLLGLVHVDRYLVRRPARAVGAAVLAPSSESRVLTPGRRLALFIACGIGLHNFAEGLSIGQSAARGQVSLAVLLIVGFGLHNATEGFGIVAPLAQETEPVSWRFLGLCGVIGGLPTFLGTIVGHAMVNDALAVGFLALAAGSIVYVIIQLVGVAIRLGYKELLVWGLFVGFLLGLGTDFVLVAADL